VRSSGVARGPSARVGEEHTARARRPRATFEVLAGVRGARYARPMQIAEGKVVTLEFVLRLADGSVVDTSEGREPLVFLHGRSTVLPGLEDALVGVEPGVAVDVELAPERAFGAHDPALVERVPRAHFHGAGHLEVGACFEAESKTGRHLATVRAIEGDEVVLDMNHPLAGETLHVHAKVVGVRDATEAELEHGHAFDAAHAGEPAHEHGPGCNHDHG
jgi:FKBP-type peptidyl-prolyl cis-trans isomerase SlyD